MITEKKDGYIGFVYSVVAFSSIRRVPQAWQNKASLAWARLHLGQTRGRFTGSTPPHDSQVSRCGALARPQYGQTFGFCGAFSSPARARVNAISSLIAIQIWGSRESLPARQSHREAVKTKTASSLPLARASHPHQLSGLTNRALGWQ